MVSSPTVAEMCDQGSHSGRAPTLVGERAHIYHRPLRHAEACHLPQSGRLLCRLRTFCERYVLSCQLLNNNFNTFPTKQLRCEFLQNFFGFVADGLEKDVFEQTGVLCEV